MGWPALTNGAQRNSNRGSSGFQVKVANGVGADLLVAAAAEFNGTKKCCCGIELAAAGTLVYTNPWGTVVTLTGLPAGYKAIEAQAIGAGTTVDVYAYF